MESHSESDKDSNGSIFPGLGSMRWKEVGYEFESNETSNIEGDSV